MNSRSALPLWFPSPWRAGHRGHTQKNQARQMQACTQTSHHTFHANLMKGVLRLQEIWRWNALRLGHASCCLSSSPESTAGQCLSKYQCTSHKRDLRQDGVSVLVSKHLLVSISRTCVWKRADVHWDGFKPWSAIAAILYLGHGSLLRLYTSVIS